MASNGYLNGFRTRKGSSEGLSRGSHRPANQGWHERLGRRVSRMKSLLIRRTYFPPQVGGISEIMAAVASALGPDRVCCLTGVPASAGAGSNSFRPKVYRRPAAFAAAKPVQAVGWATAIAEIMVRDQPSIVQLA